MDIFSKPPDVLGALARASAGLAALRPPLWADSPGLRTIAAAASVPRFTLPRICEPGILAEIERSFAPLRTLQAQCDAMARAMAALQPPPAEFLAWRTAPHTSPPERTE